MAASPTGAANSSAAAAPRGEPSRSFSHRLRCADIHRVLGNSLDSKAVQLWCDRKALQALKIFSSMAEAGDKHALTALMLLGHVGGSCDALRPSPTFSRFSAVTIERARQNGMAGEALQRVRDVLADEQAGPTEEELEACRESAAEFNRLAPAMIDQFASIVGRSIEKLRGEKDIDIQIEYDRKSLVAGDADGQLNLAVELLQKGTPASQDEALALLRESAKASPAAKTHLAICYLQGCPTPAADAREAVQLLTEAALGGDSLALLLISGDARTKIFDAESVLPVSERYAWSTFRRRLNEEGCFGTSDYLGWVNMPSPAPDLLAMSPYESAAAEARAAALLADQLDKTRAILGCNPR